MGFFFNGSRSEVKKAPPASKRIPIELLNSLGCSACPMDREEDNLRHPKMKPSGSDRPDIYILGEAPGEEEDTHGEPFIGASGRLLRSALPRDFLQDRVRISNTIRCRPPGNRPPEKVEMECCRGMAEEDIRHSAPLAIAGMGASPLLWATKGHLSSLLVWRGKRIAIEVGGHAVWFYPMLHPSYVMRNRSSYGKSPVERVFQYDWDCLLKDLKDGRIDRPPKIYKPPYDDGIEYILGDGAEDLRRLERALKRQGAKPRVAIDFETNGLRPYAGSNLIYTCAIGTFEDVVVFPIDHPEAWNSSLRPEVHRLLGEFLLTSGRKTAHNLAFEQEWVAALYGTHLLYQTEWEDTYFQAHTLDERVGAHSLEDLTLQYFGFSVKEQSRVDPVKLLQYPLKEALRYNALDSKWTDLLFYAQEEELSRFPSLAAEYRRKVSLQPALVKTQMRGVVVDFDYAEKMGEELSLEVKALESRLSKCREVIQYKNRYGAFNPAAPENVLVLMRDICRRNEVRKTAKKSGEEKESFTTDNEALSAIPEREVPSAKIILEHRAVSKLLSTYIDPILSRKTVYPDGKIHCKFSPVIAVTGRLASEDPNLQNFPKRKWKKIRGVIVPERLGGGRESVFAALDYGQIEARVIGMASEDRNLMRYLWTDYDIHGFWADRFLKEYPKIKDWVIREFEVDGDDPSAVRKTLRQEAKNKWVFPLFFGSAPKSCAESLYLPEMVADDLAKEFWSEFEGVLKWQRRLISNYEKNLYVETLTGRRRRGIMSKNELINAPVQGTAADIVLDAMDEVCVVSEAEDLPHFTPNINIHDDLTFDLPEDSLEEDMDRIGKIMCRPRFDWISVPIIIEASIGYRWDELEEVKKYRSDRLYNIRNPYA